MKEFHIYAFSDEAAPSLEGQIRALKRNALEGMEIRNVGKVNVSDLTPAQAKAISKRLDDEGLKVRSLGSPLGKIKITESFAEHLDKVKRTIETAAILGASRIRMFSFYIPKGEDPEQYFGEVTDRLGRMLDAARDCGVTLCHENEKGIYGDVAARCLKLHEALPELKAVFDPANFIQCSQPTLEAFGMLEKYIDYLHIKDALPDGRVVPAGEGAGEIGAILKKTSCAYLTLEPHLKVFDGFAALETAGATLDGVKVYPDNDSAFDAACAALGTLTQKL
ncbi:MAG: sugar phosphate isomerase/epimerase [Clostridia bacterium]|nr:sugar phosphate isomerase/epimerase [Clostridia bacterium]